MSLTIAAPESLTAAAVDIADMESFLDTAHKAAAAPATGMVAAAGDEVSAAVASLFSGHAQQYLALTADAAAFHNQFVLKHPRFHAHLVTCDRCAFRPGVERNTRPRLLRAGCGPGGA